ncbi:MAG: S1 RNA-binding domain-containing protein, partial [Nanoarchaeota archaeon]
MLLQKKGFPQEDELVLCTVTKVEFHSVFVTLDEYGKGGMIHISEVSPGRIRNIRDFVREG